MTERIAIALERIAENLAALDATLNMFALVSAEQTTKDKEQEE